MFVTLTEVKQHLNIDDYFQDDDGYINHLILVAEKVVEKHIDCDFSVLVDERGMVPSPIRHAILLFIGNLYQSRESVSFSNATELPLSFRYLLDLYMDYSGNMNIKPDMPKKKVEVKFEEKPIEKPEYEPLAPMRPPKENEHFGKHHNHNEDVNDYELFMQDVEHRNREEENYESRTIN